MASLDELHGQAQRYNGQLQEYNAKLQGELKEAQAATTAVSAARDTLAEEAAELRGQLSAAQAEARSAQVGLQPPTALKIYGDERKAMHIGHHQVTVSEQSMQDHVARLPNRCHEAASPAMFCCRPAGNMQHDGGSAGRSGGRRRAASGGAGRHGSGTGFRHGRPGGGQGAADLGAGGVWQDGRGAGRRAGRIGVAVCAEPGTGKAPIHSLSC